MRTRAALGAMCLGATCLGAGAALAGDRPEGAAGVVPYWDAEAVAAGAALYAENCAACHGAALEGEGDWRARNADGSLRAPPHDETGHTWHHPDAQIFAITKHGTEAVTGGAVQSTMEGFGDQLSDADILAVLAFIKAQWPDEIIARHDALNQRFMASQ
ncbi:MAG: c-type cytochrome [Rhodobacteraceae bacterium]|nr:MAG: c-type cytochrome [Paracoccaceae bacterium]